MPEIKIKTQDGKVLTIVAKDGKDGIQGEKGATPSKEELLDIITPLIPEPLKGEDGKTPSQEELLDLIKPLIPEPIEGKPGKDAVATEVIKEVLVKLPKPKDGKDGSPDTAEEVKRKLLEVGIDYEDIQGTPDIQQIIRVAQASKTVSLIELDDVDISGLTKVNGKYVLGGGSSAETFESVSKNIQSYPYTLAYSSGDVSTITYDLGGGLEIVKTFGYTSGDVTSITLSGDTPSGIDLVKTITYSGGAVDNITYT